MTTNTTTADTAATDLKVGDRIVISNRLARYLGEDIEGQVRPIVNLTTYDDGATIGITLRGLPEVCAMAGAPIPLVVDDGPRSIVSARRARIMWEEGVGNHLAAMYERGATSVDTSRFVWVNLGALASALYASTLRGQA